MTMDDLPDAAPPHSAASALDVERIARAVAGAPLPFRLRYFPRLDSTNTYAMRVASQAAPEGVVIITDDQFSGRGRMGRLWEGFARQQLTFSFILTPPFAANWLMMASALAVQEAIDATTGVTPAIKWPNDVLIGGKKACGILIETSGDIAVIGIGVNVNGSLAHLPELAVRATTLQDEVGHAVSREDLAAAILLALARRYDAMRAQGETGRETVRAAWRARLSTLGAHVRIDQGQTQMIGWAEDVADDGALIVRQENGERVVVTWGDVETPH
jgi:BirA family transcriptional regulator, biotin operon repressor / biotin---[acetyl-CoA-carboxylase] ligase